MLRIGDVAKQFHITNRTLRYWEEEGILKSVRTDNGYRYYDDENTLRIKQIVLLRKLKMPISEIEKIFLSADPAVVASILAAHLERLRQEKALYGALAVLVEKLIHRLQSAQDLEQIFQYLETVDIANPEHQEALQILLSERKSTMANNQLSNVRIVKIPAMTVAAYRAESATPEEDCGKVFNRFVIENNLHKRDGYRQFGFNNPSPTEGNPVYGYEMWVSVPEDFDVPQPLEKKQYAGGLYASISTCMNEIGERWMQLYSWCKDHAQYTPDMDSQWLEECSMDFETFISPELNEGEKQLDLLSPIRLKN